MPIIEHPRMDLVCDILKTADIVPPDIQLHGDEEVVLFLREPPFTKEARGALYERAKAAFQSAGIPVRRLSNRGWQPDAARQRVVLRLLDLEDAYDDAEESD